MAFLPVDTKEGQGYIYWMNCALAFAEENRKKMMSKIMTELTRQFPHIRFSQKIDCHHNYARIENHYGKNVWVHRKGAICVREGMVGLVPGAMGSYSYIVEGLGNPLGFHSCSHGAGRRMGRNEAKQTFTVQQTIEDLMKYRCLPYIMRYYLYEQSEYRGMYINIARWCNQPNFFKKKSFREFCEANGERSSTMKYLRKFEKDFPQVAKEYFDIRYDKGGII